MTSGSCLLVFLDGRMGLAISDAWPIAQVKCAGRVYKPLGPEWSGFYDWLRASNGSLLGVRYHPVEDTRFILDRAAELSYATIGLHQDASFFLTSGRDFNRLMSEDQEILYDQVFVGDDGSCAIAFATDGLTSDQLATLSQADAEWRQVQIDLQQGDRSGGE